MDSSPGQLQASARNPLSMKQFLTNKCDPVFQHPPFSPDLTRCDFCLFPKVKGALKAIYFQTVKEKKQKRQGCRKERPVMSYHIALKKWKASMQRYVSRYGREVC